MKDLIEDLRAEIVKCELSRIKKNRTEIEKKYLDGMIDAFNRAIFHIEINYIN